MSFLKNLNRKNIKLILIFTFLILTGILAIWYFVFPKNQKSEITDFVIKAEGKNQIIENKKEKFKATLPEGWEIKFVPDIPETILWIQSPNIQGKNIKNLNFPPLTKGCGIWFKIDYLKISLFEVESLIKLLHFNFAEKSDEFQKILIQNRYLAIKNITKGKVYLNKNEIQDYEAIGVYILRNDKLFTMILYYAPQEKSFCEEQFNNFLNTISIK
ncbi:MAG: hypothetical protein ACP5H7_01770 [Minisyncoccia bacterium]